MSGQIFQKIYPGEFARPTTEADYSESENVLIAATPWGNKDAMKEMVHGLKEALALSVSDKEATSPYAKLAGLSPLENNLRSAVFLANDMIYRKFNHEAYTSSCEALVLGFHGPEMAWVQVGQPHLLLLRGGELIPLQVAQDLGMDYLTPTPLPAKLVGIERQIDVEIKSLCLQPGDLVIMLSRSSIPGALFSQNLKDKPAQEALDSLFAAASTADPKAPFWIGAFER